ncbi:aminotransferase class III-fold pyridoxal phosphate-dependent enzyme, partial [Noviherbaspirillum sp.]|uniref:aminotransferase class III-fold pyridoxal phosphate-dependent enzyme n=1 Tax=Noviherbaspirillum sp. TaxID=1926288 RepID=UPI002FE12F34
QTGLARTGRLLACQHEDVKPDGLVLGKALGGGLLPVSAFLAREDVMAVFRPGDHGSTFGGNPLAAAVGTAALQLLKQENLAERAEKLGSRLLDGLRAIRHSAIREVRGKGLLIGLDLDPSHVSARTFCERLLQQGILSKETHETVVRFAPPLVITEQELDSALEVIRAVFETVPDNRRMPAESLPA